MQDVCDGLSDGNVALTPLNIDNYEFVYTVFQEEIKSGSDSAFYGDSFRVDCYWDRDASAWVDSYGNVKVFDPDFAASATEPHAFDTGETLPSPPTDHSVFVYFDEDMQAKIVADENECAECEKRVICQYGITPADGFGCDEAGC